MQVQVHIVMAFIDGDSGGNPAGVALGADSLSAEEKLAVAREVGLSETAFVSASARATLKLEFYTPRQQIAHCGHATVATFSLLRQLGIVGDGRHTKETIDGLRDIVIDAGMAFMAQRAPTYTPLQPPMPAFDAALRSLGVRREQLIDGAPPTVVNTGNGFLLVPLRSEADVAEVRTDAAAIDRLSQDLDLVGYYVFCRQTRRAGRAAAARMFAPRYGIAEEAGTGMAAGPLACYLHDVLGEARTTLLIEQGWLMPEPSPSVIRVDLRLENGCIAGLMAGGTARVVAQRTVVV